MKKAFVLFALATASVFATETAAPAAKAVDQKKTVATADEQTKACPKAKTEGGALFVAGTTGCTTTTPSEKKDEQPTAEKKADQKAAPQATAKTPAPKVAIA
jgi:hypothetical protein